MITFTVVDLGPDGQRVSLRDQHGRLHVARMLPPPAGTDRAGGRMADMPAPEVHDGLFGQEAVLGERVLVNQATHKPVPVRFEALGCSQGQALELLHPLAQPMPVAQRTPAAAVRLGAARDVSHFDERAGELR